MTKIPATHIDLSCLKRLSYDERGLWLNNHSSRPWLQCFSPAGFQWTEARLTIDSLPTALEGLRIVHISDLHFRSRWTGAYDDVLRRVRQNPPDLLFVTGDFVEYRRHHEAAIPLLERFIPQLRARYGVYGILGNHDNRRLGRQLAQWNIQMLHGRRTVIPLKNAAIELIGAIFIRRRTAQRELRRPLMPRPENSVRIFLAHYPDTLAAVERWQADIFFAGHTHGGQICLPGGVPIVRHTHFPRRFCSGIFRLGPTWVVINRGLGFATLPMRMFCPSQILDVTLTAKR